MLLTTVQAQETDALLPTLRDELSYDMRQLQQQEVKPYYMSLRVEDMYRATVVSNFGVTLGQDEQRSRTVVPQVRLGSKELDNYKYDTQNGSRAESIPMDDAAVEGIRACIWEATLDRYNQALRNYKQAVSRAATSVAAEDKAPCFSAAPQEHYYEAPVQGKALHLDRAEWEKRLNAVAAVFRQDPALSEGVAQLEYSVTRSYFLNTEGTEVVQNRVAARVMLSAVVIAADGMELPLYHDFFSLDIDSLPSTEVMVQHARNMVRRMRALKDAPVANPYTGPAILSGAASGVFFHEIFGHRLEGHRMKQGGETFKNMVGKAVLPPSFQVFSDPTLRHYAGTDLNGCYLYDSEGVKARRVDNVVNGVLREFLMSRVPLDGFPQSNGHGRAVVPNDPVSRQSNLIVESTQTYTDAQLREMLKAEAKRQGKDYGYFFNTVTSGYTLTGEGGSLNSFNVTPIEVSRIYVDGRPDELVRGVDLIGTPLSMFSHIAAAGQGHTVFTGMCGAESGWVPVTASSPAIFVNQIETQRRQKAQVTPPELSAPPFDDTALTAETASMAPTDRLIFSAMQKEMKRSKDSLCIEGYPRPFYLSYIINRFRSFRIVGELGGISVNNAIPWHLTGNTQVLVGDYHRHSGGQYSRVSVPQEADIPMIRRGFWGASDAVYKVGLNLYANKMNNLENNPLPRVLDIIPDKQPVKPVTFVQSLDNSYQVDREKLADLARELSAIFKDYPDLTGTSVSIDGAETETYRTTSEQVNIKLPDSYVSITARATLRDTLGLSQSDQLTLHYRTPAEIPSTESLREQIHSFAKDLVALKNAPELEDYYKGPVLYQGAVVASIFQQNLLENNGIYARQMTRLNTTSIGRKLNKEVMDKRFTILNYTDRTSYHGVPLTGFYPIDADGIKPEPVIPIVEKGILKTMLNGTTPSEYSKQSTGSTRFTGINGPRTTTTSIGTLHVMADKALKEEKMFRQLLKAAKQQKLKEAYVIFCPTHCSLRRLYHVDVKTGKKTLLKSNSITLPTLTQLENVVAVSSKEEVVNRVNTTVIYPASLIVGNLEVNKSGMVATKEPAILYPLKR